MAKTTKPRTRLGAWLEAKLLRWQFDLGAKQTVQAWADHLGVTRDAYNKWVSGARVPSEEQAAILASRLGMEVYDVIGIPRPDPRLRVVIENWGQFSDEAREKFAAEAREEAARSQALGIVGDSSGGMASSERRSETGI